MSTAQPLSRPVVRSCALLLGIIIAACSTELSAPATNDLAPPNFNHLPGQVVGHHQVHYLDYSTDGNGVHTARWAVTELGCEAYVPPSGKGKGGTNCNSMSHIAFTDFVGSMANLRKANATDDTPFSNSDIYTTYMGAGGCGTIYVCVESNYGHYYGASKPDGQGSWIKYSTINGVTIQVAKDFTQIFTVRFRCTGVQNGTVTAAIKSGNIVEKGVVPGPSCS